METLNVEISKEDLESWYDKSDNFSCDICQKIFDSNVKLNLHRVKVHRILQNASDVCIFHRRRSEQKCIYHCPQIGCKYYQKIENAIGTSIGFKCRRDLQQHYDKVHREKDLICRFCKLSKFSLERLRRFHEIRCSGQNLLPSAASVNVIESACPLSSCFPCSPPLKQKRVSNGKINTSNLAPRMIVIQQPIVYYINVSNNVDKANRDMSCQADFDSAKLGTRDKCSQCTQTLNNELQTCIPDQMVRDYDDMACQTVRTETYGAAVQYSAPQSHIFCQTVNPATQDVSVITDFDQFFDESNEQLVSSRDVNLGNTSIFSKDNHDCSTMQNRMVSRGLLSMSPAVSLSLSSDREDLEEENSLLTWCDTHTQTINFAPTFEQQSIETQTYFGHSSLFSNVETQTLEAFC